MAYTRIHNIKTTLKKALDYIENPDKTDDELLVSGYNVDPLTASLDFCMTAELAKEMKGDYTNPGSSKNLAHHLIQSFAPYDKITPAEAHDLGKKWADEILQGKHEYVISTHLDKGHIHNHVIFNATSFYDYSKFDNYKVAGKLREISDKLCKEKGLFVADFNKKKGKSQGHYEWEMRKQGQSWKAKLESLIDRAIIETVSFEQFIVLMNKYNVEVGEGKHIKFRLQGQERFCRGYTIGENYTREAIIKRLSETNKEILSNPGSKDKYNSLTSFDLRVEADAHNTKYANTKELSDVLMTIRREGISEQSDLAERISSLTVQAGELNADMKEIDEKNNQYKNAAKYLLAYNQYLPVKQEHSKQSPISRKKFEVRHDGELRAFDHAAAQLERLGVNTNVNSEKVLTLVKDQDIKIGEINSMVKIIGERVERLRTVQDIVNKIHVASNPIKEAEKKKPAKQEEL